MRAAWRGIYNGILAACFGDGSMRVFEIPAVPEERLQMELDKEQHLVDKNIPIVVARLPRIMQLSVQWSPHTWNVLLTGGSDGSVSLWNIKSAVSESDSLGDERIEPEPIEPQRRFQDGQNVKGDNDETFWKTNECVWCCLADTIGKQEAFDWAVAGSQSVPLPGLRLMSIYSQRLEMCVLPLHVLYKD
ncbi:WD40 repeat, conserved site [Phytophthora cactorum]|nr:WD40 repeat, conserved site [Phytophthora cactorum]